MMHSSLLCAAVLACASLAPASHAANRLTIGECVKEASETFEIPGIVLATILLVEGGRVGSESPNKNGSFDLGPFQINTIHLAEFDRYGVSREMLRDDACVNTAAAGFLLRRHYNSTRDWGAAITRYHSATPEHAARYAGLAVNALKKLNRPTKATGP